VRGGYNEGEEGEGGDEMVGGSEFFSSGIERIWYINVAVEEEELRCWF
jgi:hypothetical protein